jgi:hypothetical protein
MTFMTHVHPQFDSVFSIEAVNEPLMDAAQTPGLGDCKQTSPAADLHYPLTPWTGQFKRILSRQSAP